MVSLLDFDGEDEGLEDDFFPGSDDELGFLEDEDEEHHDESDPEEPTYAIRRSYSDKSSNHTTVPFLGSRVTRVTRMRAQTTLMKT